MSDFKRTFLYTLAIGTCMIIAFMLGFIAHARLIFSLTDFPLLQESYNILDRYALEPIPTQQALEYGMIRGMIQAYGDPHTSFLEPPQAELQTQALHGSYGGIGTKNEKDPDGNYILYPFPDSPAQKAGIQDGDRLLKVDDLDVTPDTSQEIIAAAIRGPVDQSVSITIGRAPDFTPQEFKIKRAEIPLPSVTWHLDIIQPLVGIIQVNLIADTTAGEIKKAVADLQARGATHFVLDLRNNGGGLLDAGVDTARLFLIDGVVIEQQYRGKDVESFKVEAPGALADIPLAVLINGGTASAAEIIAGALQAHHRAILIGSTSYGKNTIQMVFELQDDSSLHVTAAHWWIPGLDQPRTGHGLLPDIVIAPDDTSSPDPALQTAISQFFPR